MQLVSRSTRRIKNALQRQTLRLQLTNFSIMSLFDPFWQHQKMHWRSARSHALCRPTCTSMYQTVSQLISSLQQICPASLAR